MRESAVLAPKQRVVVHPLVLLSVVDHYNRVAKDGKRRVMGVLLGQVRDNVINVANSFAVPFEEDEKTPSVWFLDHNYVETMRDMYKKINAKEVMVGWYHSGPKLRSSDLAINQLFQNYISQPVLVIINVQPTGIGLPTNAYFAEDEVQEDGTTSKKTFCHVPSEISAEEAEEIGVEHLLRDVKDSAVGLLSTQLQQKQQALQGLAQRLDEIRRYLQQVSAGALPLNLELVVNLQEIFNLLPNLDIRERAETFAVQTNDQYLLVYTAVMVRAIISLHDLANNKAENRESEAALEKKEAAAAAAADASAAANPASAAPNAGTAA